MKITEIKKLKTKYKIVFDDSRLVTILPTTKEDFQLYTNKEIEENKFFELKKYNEEEELFQFAVEKAVLKDYAPAKLKEVLLKKNKNKSVVNKVIKRLQKYELVNEDEIIKNVIEYCDKKHYGFNRIIKMLKDRGISIDKIEKLNMDESRERKEAIKQTESLVRRYKKKNTVNLKRNIYSALIRYGFDENIASIEASKVFNSHSTELNMLKLDYDKLVSSYSRKVKGKELYNKITKSLLSKGYRINDIKSIIKEENTYEMD